MADVIVIKNIWKQYHINTSRKLTEVISTFFSNKQYQKRFWALKGVNFSVTSGKILGIIGLNGSGKSTLLKILSGVTTPTIGNIIIQGRVVSLLELGTGFHPELTGRENIFLNGLVLGLDKKAIDRKLEQIIEFAGIKKFIDTPLKYYSSGMQMKLAFSIAAYVEPEILLIDEVLAVGDTAFQEKCLVVFEEFKKRGVTIILVSHDIDFIRKMCDQVVLINDGQIVATGDSNKVIKGYLKIISKKNKYSIVEKKNRWGDGKARITSIWMKGDKENSDVFFDESIININIKVKFFVQVSEPIFGIIIRDERGISVFESNTKWLKIKTGEFQENQEKTVSWQFKNYFDTGKYSISPAVAYKDANTYFDWREKLLWFSVKKNYKTGGLVNFKHSFKIK